jgi:hypothetical protein
LLWYLGRVFIFIFLQYKLRILLGVFSGVFAASASLLPSEARHSGISFAASGAFKNEDIPTPAEHAMQVNAFQSFQLNILCARILHQIVSACTHHFPDYWLQRCHTEQVRAEFQDLFPYKTKLFALELLSVVLTPLILFFSLPR